MLNCDEYTRLLWNVKIFFPPTWISTVLFGRVKWPLKIWKNYLEPFKINMSINCELSEAEYCIFSLQLLLLNFEEVEEKLF